MMQSSVTISLVPEAKGGPFVFQGELDKSCRLAKEIGFDAVELFVPSAEKIDRRTLKQTLAKHGLKLAAIGTGAGFLLHNFHLCDSDPARRQDSIHFIADIIELAGSFQAMAIVGSMQGSSSVAIGRVQAVQWVREGLNQLGPLAKRCGVPLILEPLNRYETNLLNRLEQGVEMVRSLDTDDVRLLADLFHMNIEEGSICDALRQSAEYVAHLHFADSNRRPAGSGHTDLAEIGRTLREIGYEGYVSAEALPYPNPKAAAEQTMREFNKHMSFT